MNNFQSIPVKLNNFPVAAVVFDASKGWEYAEKVAKWVCGEISRDPRNPDKTYYWRIFQLQNPFSLTPGDVAVKFSDNTFKSVSSKDFASLYVYNNNSLGVLPCYFSREDGKYHKRYSSYSDLAGHARCHMQSVEDGEIYTSNVNPAKLCVECFGQRG